MWQDPSDWDARTRQQWGRFLRMSRSSQASLSVFSCLTMGPGEEELSNGATSCASASRISSQAGLGISACRAPLQEFTQELNVLGKSRSRGKTHACGVQEHSRGNHCLLIFSRSGYRLLPIMTCASVFFAICKDPGSTAGVEVVGMQDISSNVLRK